MKRRKENKRKEKRREENVLRHEKSDMLIEWKKCNENIVYFGRKVQCWLKKCWVILGVT